MQAKLIINGVNFAQWIKSDGMTQSDIRRNSKSLVTLDGVEHRTGIVKRAISVELVTMRDDTLSFLSAALTSPAAVQYTDRDGYDRTSTFYVSDPVSTAKMIRRGVTYWDGIGFTLEER